MLVIHDEELAQQLEAIAAQENRPVEEVLKSLLSHYSATAPLPSLDEAWENTSQWLTSHIEDLAFETESPINPEEADELLRADFADALWKRMTNGTPSNTD